MGDQWPPITMALSCSRFFLPRTRPDTPSHLSDHSPLLPSFNLYPGLFFFALLSFRFSSSSPSLKYCHFIPISFDWTIGSSFSRLSHITLSLSHLLSHSHIPFMSHCTISSPYTCRYITRYSQTLSSSYLS